MADELMYRQERFSFHGDVYWQSSYYPWQLVTTLTGVNISLTGLLAQITAESLLEIFFTGDTVLQVNAGDLCAVVPAKVVRRNNQHQVAFSFGETNDDLALLISQVRYGDEE